MQSFCRENRWIIQGFTRNFIDPEYGTLIPRVCYMVLIPEKLQYLKNVIVDDINCVSIEWNENRLQTGNHVDRYTHNNINISTKLGQEYCADAPLGVPEWIQISLTSDSTSPVAHQVRLLRIPSSWKWFITDRIRELKKYLALACKEFKSYTKPFQEPIVLMNHFSNNV